MMDSAECTIVSLKLVLDNFKQNSRFLRFSIHYAIFSRDQNRSWKVSQVSCGTTRGFHLAKLKFLLPKRQIEIFIQVIQDIQVNATIQLILVNTTIINITQVSISAFRNSFVF